MNTNIIGAVTELKCMTYFLELGYNVSVPQAPCRYDFILDTGKELLKIQVKTSHFEEDGIVFSTSSAHYINGKFIHTDYKEDNIDYFCTWYENKCYLILVSECGKSEKKLRTQPTKNGQIKNISFAKDYIAEEVLQNR